MIFSVVIHGAPFSSQAADSAYRFTEAALQGNHQIYRLFFYGDGVHNASSLASPPQGELDLPAHWNKLVTDYNLDGVVCIAAAIRRGILNEAESNRYEKPASNLNPAFELSGLGQLVDACTHSDRVISFG